MIDTAMLRQIADELDAEAVSLGSIADGEHCSEAGVCRNAADEIDRLRPALLDIKQRLENSWERRDLALDSDLEAVERANKLLGVK